MTPPAVFESPKRDESIRHSDEPGKDLKDVAQALAESGQDLKDVAQALAAAAATDAQAKALAIEEARREAEFRKNSPVKALAKDYMGFAKLEAVKRARPIKEALTKAKAEMQNADKIALAKSSAGNILDFATTTRLGMTLMFALVGSMIAGSVGAFIGSLFGLLIGVLLAIFTFGLSIPIGGLIGFSLGATFGAMVGGVSGAALGYCSFAYRKELCSLAEGAHTRLLSSAACIQNTAKHMSGSLQSLIVGSTGGTDGSVAPAKPS